MAHIWSAKTRPNSDLVYAATRIDGHEVKLHRFVLDAAPGTVIDHEDRDGLNNRRSNLRYVTHRQNAMNRKRYDIKATPYKGVYPSGRKWRVMIDGRHGGMYDTAEEAAHAYDRHARERFGEFARLNFPNG